MGLESEVKCGSGNKRKEKQYRTVSRGQNSGNRSGRNKCCGAMWKEAGVRSSRQTWPVKGNCDAGPGNKENKTGSGARRLAGKQQRRGSSLRRGSGGRGQVEAELPANKTARRGQVWGRSGETEPGSPFGAEVLQVWASSPNCTTAASLSRCTAFERAGSPPKFSQPVRCGNGNGANTSQFIILKQIIRTGKTEVFSLYWDTYVLHFLTQYYLIFILYHPSCLHPSEGN